MWIVRLALRRPYTFVVMAMLIVVAGVYSVLEMPTDILPEINIPVIAVVWQYGGLPPDEMELRFTSNYERALTTTVAGIEHIESQSLYGVSVTKVFFHPGTKMEMANAQVTAISQTLLKAYPLGATPPLIVNYSASNVPILQGSIHSETLSEQQLFDLTSNFLRTGLATVQGAQMPFPYGGKQRQVMIDIDLTRLYALGLSPSDVSNAVQAQNLVLPSGTTKLGTQELLVRLNGSPDTVGEIAALPIKSSNGSTVTIGDVAHVRDGYAPQTSMVRANGRRGILMTLLKSAGASTLDIVSRVRAVMPSLLATLPPEYKMDLLFDQSVFVRAAIDGVLKEGAIAAALTALMILLFLGSWRSTLIVVTSIPLSILVSFVCLAALGETINLMTLGGLSLAVGILVDDATVELENIHRNLAMKKPLLQAILDGAKQIALPALVATLCICIVFIPVLFISGAARSLFTPLGMAVVFAMMASYFLSRTLVPTMVHYLLAPEVALVGGQELEPPGPQAKKRDVFWRIHQRFNVSFERLRRSYGGYLDWALDHGRWIAAGFAVLIAGSLLALFPSLGRDFFPSVDAGQIRFHVRTTPGTRVETTENVFARAEDLVRATIPAEELETIIDNIGLPISGLNLALGDPSMISSADGEVLVQLKPKHHATPGYIKELRRRLPLDMPEADVFFLAPDITTQVLNFGLTAPIDVQIVGPRGNNASNYALARRLRDSIARVRGAVDVHLAQVVDQPELRLKVDRAEASLGGATARDIATDALVSLSSTGQVAPSFWLDTQKGVQYLVAVQTPQYKLDTLEALNATPVHLPNGGIGGSPQTLGNLATVERDATPVNATHYNALSTFDVQANVQGTDLGSVSDAVDRLVADAKKASLPRGTSIAVRGQVESMNASFRGLSFGIVAAILLVYLLLVVNFQSWLDPLIILMALPGGLAGIVWALFATGTTLSVPALMGAIMSIGVATSNSILMVTFANDQRKQGDDARRAAWLAGVTRLRPVMMTALAMILGMLPMSLGLGEGGEQNAPLGRAVIGGLLAATFMTLFFVPIVYSAWRKDAPRATELEGVEA
ncbi:MAG: efflux RND transporter permease subunit [Myxococcota bacterium]|nr:efflux RND transporter permease subunit [Myxococcota bacterium]